MSMHTNIDRWLALWQRLGLPGDGASWHQRLIKAYSEPQRHYHTMQHLEECLAELDAAETAGHITSPDMIQAALWFHDAVYDPQGSDNEELSAQMAENALTGSSYESSVRRLIMLTKKHEPEGGADDAWMINIDLAIFGQPAERALEYERQIRQEYAWVPEAAYREKRREILAAFLSRPRIYLTDWFHARYDRRARENLAVLIHAL